MTTILLWGFGIVGAIIVVAVVALIILAVCADSAQRNGNNWFR